MMVFKVSLFFSYIATTFVIVDCLVCNQIRIPVSTGFTSNSIEDEWHHLVSFFSLVLNARPMIELLVSIALHLKQLIVLKSKYYFFSSIHLHILKLKIRLLIAISM